MNDKINIQKNGFAELDSFTERLCETNRLYNYMGAVSTTLQCLLSFANDNLTIEKSQYKDGICLTVTTQSPVFSSFGSKDSSESNSDTMFLVNTLTDGYDVSKDGKSITLFFQVNGIEEELTIDRQQKIRTYSRSKTTILN